MTIFSRFCISKFDIYKSYNCKEYGSYARQRLLILSYINGVKLFSRTLTGKKRLIVRKESIYEKTGFLFIEKQTRFRQKFGTRFVNQKKDIYFFKINMNNKNFIMEFLNNIIKNKKMKNRILKLVIALMATSIVILLLTNKDIFS